MNADLRGKRGEKSVTLLQKGFFTAKHAKAAKKKNKTMRFFQDHLRESLAFSKRL
jgi:hypothetical protein